MPVYRHIFSTHDTPLVMRTCHVSCCKYEVLNDGLNFTHLQCACRAFYLILMRRRSYCVLHYKRYVGALYLLTLTDTLKVGILAIFPEKVCHLRWNSILFNHSYIVPISNI